MKRSSETPDSEAKRVRLEVEAKGGLKVPFHPALLAKVTQPRAKEKQVDANPYLSKPTRVKKREFKFHEQGKFIELANEQRTQERLQKLKKDILEATSRTGLERELELVSDLSIRNTEPPLVEWWDAQLVFGSYEEIDFENELISNLIQHPVKLNPVLPEPPRELILTEKERKKLSRQKRLEKQRDKQDRIRLGLLPPEEPKITKQNFMRVLGHEAILAPSEVEQQMARQVAERQQKHLDLIAATKLTEEERKEKKDRKLREDTSEKVSVAVFKINRLNHKPHLFKINANAQQYKLTGAGILNKSLNLVVVEGGPKGIKAYKKLMLNRINWEEKPDTDQGTPETSPNECILIWEGEIPVRNFKYFKMKTFEARLEVKEYLESMNVVHYWNAARMYLQSDY